MFDKTRARREAVLDAVTQSEVRGCRGAGRFSRDVLADVLVWLLVKRWRRDWREAAYEDFRRECRKEWGRTDDQRVNVMLSRVQRWWERFLDNRP